MLTKAKARKILKDGSVKGHKLTKKQKGFFAAKGYYLGGQAGLEADNRQFKQETDAIGNAVSAIPFFGQIAGPLIKLAGTFGQQESTIMSHSPGRYAYGGSTALPTAATDAAFARAGKTRGGKKKDLTAPIGLGLATLAAGVAGVSQLKKQQQQPVTNQVVQMPSATATPMEKELNAMNYNSQFFPDLNRVNYQTMPDRAVYAPTEQPASPDWALNYRTDNISQEARDAFDANSPTMRPTTDNNPLGAGLSALAAFAKNGGNIKKNYATGGDIPLSSTAFQVQGNPGQVDSEQYSMGGRNVRLDHNEVVKQGQDSNYVFSERLKPSGMKESFADIAAKQERRIKRAEKNMTSNPHDTIAKNTINRLNENLANLAGAQEIKASLDGLRQPLADAATGQVPGYQAGGPILPFNDQMPYIDAGTKLDSYGNQRHYYYDPYNKNMLVRNQDGQYSIDNSRRANKLKPTDQRISGHMSQYPDVRPTGKVGQLARGQNWTTTEGGMHPYAAKAVDASGNPIIASGPDANGNDWAKYPIWGTPEGYTGPMMWTGKSSEPVTTGKGKGKGKGSGKASTPAASRTSLIPPGVNGTRTYSTAHIGMTQMPDGSWVPNDPFGPTPSTQQPLTMDQRAAQVSSMHLPFIDDNQKDAYNKPWKTDAGRQMGLVGDRTTDSTTTDNTAAPVTPFTVGDAMQTVSALSKFGMLIGGPEKQRLYSNAIPVTKESFDPTNALYQNQRSFTNAWNATSNIPSINTQRAVLNSLYASNLSQQNNIMSQYQRMNQAANTQYEDRLAARRRENLGYKYTVDDINARNRGAYMNAVQNAFDTLSGLGQNFNQKSESNATMALYQEMYKDVFNRFYDKMLQDKLNLTPPNPQDNQTEQTLFGR